MKSFLTLFSLIIGCQLMLSAQCPPSQNGGIHVVQKGENLYRISQAYEVSMGQICQWNNMQVSDILPACTELRVIPPLSKIVPKDYNEEFTERGVPNQVKAYQRQGKRHIVRTGETIAGLAELYGFTEWKFRAINAMHSVGETTIGSSLLTTECLCDVVNVDTYSSPIPRKSNPSTIPNVPSPNKNKQNPKLITPSERSTENEVMDGKGVETAVSNSFMTNEEIAMVNEINLLRSNPMGYIPFVEQYRIDKKALGYGVSDFVVEELKAELARTPRLSNLQSASCLHLTAKNHGTHLRNTNQLSHIGVYNNAPDRRIKGGCVGVSQGAENLVGGMSNVRDAVILLLLDTKDVSRKNRRNLLNADWTHLACYKAGTVAGHNDIWVQNFAQQTNTTPNQQSQPIIRKVKPKQYTPAPKVITPPAKRTTPRVKPKAPKPVKPSIGKYPW